MIDDVVTSEFWCITRLELLTAMPQGQLRCAVRLVQALGSLLELSELLQFLAQGQPLSCQRSLRSAPGAFIMVKSSP